MGEDLWSSFPLVSLSEPRETRARPRARHKAGEPRSLRSGAQQGHARMFLLQPTIPAISYRDSGTGVALTARLRPLRLPPATLHLPPSVDSTPISVTLCLGCLPEGRGDGRVELRCIDEPCELILSCAEVAR